MNLPTRLTQTFTEKKEKVVFFKKKNIHNMRIYNVLPKTQECPAAPSLPLAAAAAGT